MPIKIKLTLLVEDVDPKDRIWLPENNLHLDDYIYILDSIAKQYADDESGWIKSWKIDVEDVDLDSAAKEISPRG